MNDRNAEKRPVPGYEGLYSVTSDGKLISEERYVKGVRKGKMTDIKIKERELKNITNVAGYKMAALYKDSVKVSVYVHRLVAEVFLPPPSVGQTQVRHKEGNPELCGKDDLEWGTPTENSMDRLKHGTMKNGEKSPTSKLTDEIVLQIRARLSNKEPQKSLADEFEVDQSTISFIGSRKRWTHI